MVSQSANFGHTRAAGSSLLQKAMERSNQEPHNITTSVSMSQKAKMVQQVKANNAYIKGRAFNARYNLQISK